MGRYWDEDNVGLLIEIIKKCEAVWNTKHPRYTTNKKVRHNSWIEITNFFNDYSKEKYQPRELLSKWNLLKWQFEKQMKKTCAFGLKSSWRHYDKLSFLATCPKKSAKVKKQYSLRKSSKGDEGGSISEKDLVSETDNVTEKDVVSEKDLASEKDLLSNSSVSSQVLFNEDVSHTSEATNGGCDNVGVKPEPAEDELLSNLAISEKGKSNCEMQKTFGNYVAEELMHLNLDLQFKAKKIIFNVLMDLQQEQEQRTRRAQA